MDLHGASIHARQHQPSKQDCNHDSLATASVGVIALTGTELPQPISNLSSVDGLRKRTDVQPMKRTGEMALATGILSICLNTLLLCN